MQQSIELRQGWARLNTSESKGSIQQSTVGLGIPSSQGSLILRPAWHHHSNGGGRNLGKKSNSASVTGFGGLLARSARIIRKTFVRHDLS